MQDLIRRQPGVLCDPGRLHRRRHAQRDLPQPRHATPRRSRSSSIPSRPRYRDLLEFFFQVHDPTTQEPPGQRPRAELPLGDLLHRATSRSGSPRTPSPTSTPRACGRARSSPRSRRRARSGRPSPSTRTTSSATPTATPATSSGRTGSCPTGHRRPPNSSQASRAGCGHQSRGCSLVESEYGPLLIEPQLLTGSLPRRWGGLSRDKPAARRGCSRISVGTPMLSSRWAPPCRAGSTPGRMGSGRKTVF